MKFQVPSVKEKKHSKVQNPYIYVMLQGRIPFHVPEQVPWAEVAKMLSTKFAQMTGRGLTDQNLRYLANKLFNTTGQQDHSQTHVSWSQFNRVGYS